MLEVPEDFGADRRQAALTRRFLKPALPALALRLLEMRAETDRALGPRAANQYGKPYPYGFCAEITLDVMARMRGGVARPLSAGDRALRVFLEHGGEIRMIWGVLRDRYFQNAIRIGDLYVDVSNDTVDINKPKVEILPMRESGLAPVRDVAHFVGIGETYLDGRFFTNTVLPSLAPAFPMVFVARNGGVQLQARNTCMVSLFAADGFHQAEQWLREAPAPPPKVVTALRAVCSPALLAENPETGVDAALEACERLRAAGVVTDAAWILDMFAQYDRAPSTRLGESLGGVADIGRANARPKARIVKAHFKENQGVSNVRLECNRNIFLC